ncbi:deoxyuridine 5'-triphosphate nucleotidohydrolase-like, partial [Phyllostomus discolor]|uniref:Deoxyuridine 5'-triphosphate nucleotidohydrolase n=1 Tax=Phyllostomus discolor TaxID=89673 RepID=A0A7E6CKH5_9CHIR
FDPVTSQSLCSPPPPLPQPHSALPCCALKSHLPSAPGSGFAGLLEHATASIKGSAWTAVYDLYSTYDYTVPPVEKTPVKTNTHTALSSQWYGRVALCSGMAAKHFIDTGTGIIKKDYRGNIVVVLFNFGKEKLEVKKGDQTAQLICALTFYPEIEKVQHLDNIKKGSGGFSPTVKNKIDAKNRKMKKCTFFLKIKSSSLLFCTSVNLIALASKNVWFSYIKERVLCWDHTELYFVLFFYI